MRPQNLDLYFKKEKTPSPTLTPALKLPFMEKDRPIYKEPLRLREGWANVFLNNHFRPNVFPAQLQQPFQAKRTSIVAPQGLLV